MTPGKCRWKLSSMGTVDSLFRRRGNGKYCISPNRITTANSHRHGEAQPAFNLISVAAFSRHIRVFATRDRCPTQLTIYWEESDRLNHRWSELQDELEWHKSSVLND
jgi:hypothetical protein